MDKAILDAISIVGFPILATIGLAYFGKGFIVMTMEQNQVREEKLIEANSKLSEQLQIVADTTESTSVQLNRLCDKMDKLEDKVDMLEMKIHR